MAPDTERNHVSSYISNATCLLGEDQVASAQYLVDTVLDSDPVHLDALRLKASILTKLNKPELALDILVSVSRKRCAPEDLFAIANLHYQMGHDEEAIESYLKVVSTFPNDYERLFAVYKNLGNLFLRSGDLDTAEENYNRAFALDSSSVALLVNYGTLEIQRQQYSSAAERFRSALGREPKNDGAWVGLALCHYQMGDHHLAEANLACALDLNANNRVALRLALDWAAKHQNWSWVLEKIDIYLSRNGQDAEIMFAKAQIHFVMGQYVDALVAAKFILAVGGPQPTVQNFVEIVEREMEK